MSDFSSSDFQDPRSAPTVTRDKWIAHACNKMAKGYSLIVSPTKRNATFFMRGKGYDPCPYVTAKRLLEMKLVEETGTHALGTVYTLIEGALSTPPPKPVMAPVDVDDEDDEPADESLLEALESLEDVDGGDDEEDEEAEPEEDAEGDDRP